MWKRLCYFRAIYVSVSFSFLFNRNVFEGLEARTQYRYRLKCMNDFGSSAWSAVVTVSTTKKPQTSEDLQRAVIKGDWLGLLLPGMTVLQTLALSGVEGSVLQEYHLNALFSGLYKKMSWRMLSPRCMDAFSSMIDCLVPLSKRSHHLFSLTELNLDQLLINECKLCSFLESLRFIHCLQRLNLNNKAQNTTDCFTTEANKLDCFILTSLTHLKGVCVTPVFARVFGRSLLEMPSLETFEIIGIGGIMRAEDMEALFGGFTKTMPLRSLTFKNFSVRWCLAPLIRKLRFYLNLEDLDLKTMP